MLRKDYFKFCVCRVLGFTIENLLLPLLGVWVIYTYLDLSKIRDLSYYGYFGLWVLILCCLWLIGYVLIAYSTKIYNYDYGVKSVSVEVTLLDEEANKLKLTGKDRELFKKRKHKANKLYACDMTSLFNIIRDCLSYGSLGFLAGVVVFMFLYLLTAMPVMITLSCELVKLGLAAFFAGFCWSV